MYEIHYFFIPTLEQFADFDGNDWHLYPVTTLATAKLLRDSSHLSRSIENLNACFDRLQKISLDFLTVNLYGRKHGRAFLLALQEHLTQESLLSYSNQLRQDILKQLGLATSDFLNYRNFAKTELVRALQTFNEGHFSQAPAAQIYTNDECLQLESCHHHLLQDFLEKIQKSA